MSKVLILGLGNPLLKDDGIGPRVIRAIKAEKLPPYVCAAEAGGVYFRYWDLLLQSRHVIAVDSLLGGGPPGSVYMIKPEQLEIESNYQMPHELHFLDALKLAALHGAQPDTTIIGVEPEEISYAFELSGVVERKIPVIISLIRGIIKKIPLESSLTKRDGDNEPKGVNCQA